MQEFSGEETQPVKAVSTELPVAKKPRIEPKACLKMFNKHTVLQQLTAQKLLSKVLL